SLHALRAARLQPDNDRPRHRRPSILRSIRHNPGAYLPPCAGYDLYGSITVKRLPDPGLLLAVRLPPWRSKILRHIASPIPLPSYTSWVCSRWNGKKIRSRYFSSKPMPLSSTYILTTLLFSP